MTAMIHDIVRGIADGLGIIEEAVGPLALGLVAAGVTVWMVWS